MTSRLMAALKQCVFVFVLVVWVSYEIACGSIRGTDSYDTHIMCGINEVASNGALYERLEVTGSEFLRTFLKPLFH